MPISPENVFHGRISTVFIRDDGILQIDIKDDGYFELADAKEVIEAAGRLGDGRKFLNLIIAGEGTLVEADARIHSSSVEGSKYKLADAFVINSLAQQLIANFIIKAQKPAVATAFFKDRDKAILWLKSQFE